MIVLALDTTTPPGSCAVARDGQVVHELAGDARLSHAERLPLDLMRVLAEAQMTLAGVDGFAVATGPGSFTGLRVGIASMQGLAFAAAKPLFGISALEALARLGGPAHRTATWVDAWREEVYGALYEDGRAIDGPVVGSVDELLTRYETHPGAVTRFIGDGAAAHWERVRERWGDAAELAAPTVPLIAGTVALLATAAAARGERPAPDRIRPLYVRRPDAERARDARSTR